MNTTFYRIGHTELAIAMPADMPRPGNLIKFRTDTLLRPDDEVIRYTVSYTEQIAALQETLAARQIGPAFHRDDLTVFETAQGECRFIKFRGAPQLYAISEPCSPREYRIWFDKTITDMLIYDPVFLAPFCLEKHAFQDGGLILHSAYMCYEDTAVLFSAPSETGKSTQANLWAQHRGTWTVNGDRSLLVRESAGWYAHGWPVCGSSEICNNQAYPIRAIVMLAQAEENRAYPLSGLRAVMELLPQITINGWNPAFRMQAMDHLEQLLREVPVYKLECDISEDAVRCLEEILPKKPAN